MDKLHYLYGKPYSQGVIKANASDFVVQEILGYTPEGKGEHVMVYIRKQQCNTQYVADKLADFMQIPRRQVSYAGLKDRHAVTEQWFCLHLPGNQLPDFSSFTVSGCDVLTVSRQRKKLRIGALKANAFTLIIRNISHPQDIKQRLPQIITTGVPNYFGEQRFGRHGDNLAFAEKWATGEIKVKDRQKRSFYLSAARSFLFNHIVSQRLDKDCYDYIMVGDVLQLSGSHSWFVAKQEELGILQDRLIQQDIHLTAPLIGEDEWGTTQQSFQFEKQCVESFPLLLSLVNVERMQSTRRAIRVIPQSCEYLWLEDNCLQLQFRLPAGSYATSVLRELVAW